MLISLCGKHGVGKTAIVDEADYVLLKYFRWHLFGGYVGHSRRDENGKSIVLFMHRIIINAPDGLEVDHINGNPFDNRRENLRLATRSQNCMNQKPKTRELPKGVSIWRRGGSAHFVAQIKINGKRIFLGRFADQRDAAQAYNVAAKKYFGEFARSNLTIIV